MEDNQPRKLSTSALAKALEVPTQQLFSTLKDYGWIRKLEEGWALTGKGEFEGGEYVHSKRYGRYIVWPQEITDHPLFKALEGNRHHTASQLGKPYGLSARETNRVLAEIGWIQHGPQGWELTTLGQKQGGVVMENESSGAFYVVWPQTVERDGVLSEQLRKTADIFTRQMQESGDLFAATEELRAPDGHCHSSRLALQVCHWLYLAGIAHAVNRQLPVEDVLVADFYLPTHHIYIECWDESGAGLAARMQRRETYQQLSFPVIDIEAADADHLDEVLTRELRKLGVRIY